MTLAGNWNKIRTDNNAAFGAAIAFGGGSEAEWAAQSEVPVTLTYVVTGDKIEATRSYAGKNNSIHNNKMLI